MRYSRMRPFLLTIGACLASCSSAPTRIFTLDVVPPTAPVDFGAGADLVWIEPVHLPAGTDRLEMTHRGDGPEVVLDDLNHWAASPGELSRQTLARDLAQRLGPRVMTAPRGLPPARACRVAVDVVAFTETAAVDVLNVVWSVTAPAGSSCDRIAMSGRHQVEVKVVADGTRGGRRTATAFGRLLGLLADHIALGFRAA